MIDAELASRLPRYSADNVLAWVKGYNFAVPYSAHLWTLSFEMQVYLCIPLAFVAYRKFGSALFTKGLALIWIYCVALRVLLALIEAPHPIVWVTPFLRPEAVLLGLMLTIHGPSWNPIFSAVGACAALAVLSFLPAIDTSTGMIATYPVTAVAAALVLDTALRGRVLASVLQWPPFRFLGQISFGLYVFHFIGMALGKDLLLWLGLPFSPTSVKRVALWLGCTLSVTFALSLVSYYALERPFLKLKSRKFSAVEGRAVQPMLRS